MIVVIEYTQQFALEAAALTINKLNDLYCYTHLFLAVYFNILHQIFKTIESLYPVSYDLFYNDLTDIS